MTSSEDNGMVSPRKAASTYEFPTEVTCLVCQSGGYGPTLEGPSENFEDSEFICKDYECGACGSVISLLIPRKKD